MPRFSLSRSLLAGLMACQLLIAFGCGGDDTQNVNNCTTAADCEDHDACTTDACTAGKCAHAAVSTDDQNACTTDACSATGGVTHTPVNVDDGDACTTDACDAATGAISHTAVNVDDGDSCTTDSCDAATGQVSHTAVNVDDGDACTTDACDATNGVTHTAVNTDDGDACTTDACDATNGVTHTAVNTDDGVACTTDACDPSTGVSHTANDAACGAGEYCDTTNGCTASPQNGAVVVSEFSVFGTQFVELYNPGAAAVDVHGFVLENGAGATATIRATTDVNGTNNDPVTIAAGGYAYGVVNPSGAITGSPNFVYGNPGDTFALNTAGDVLAVLSNGGGTLEDVVDFTAFHTDPDTAMAATDFPGFNGLSTQVDPASLSATGNDSGANWCTTFYSATTRSRVADTAGAANGSCNTAVINEALMDTPGADDGNTFVEIAGPGGMLIGGGSVQDMEGSTTGGGKSNTTTPAVIPAGTRIPVNGLLVVADELATSGTTNVTIRASDVIVSDMDAENGNASGDALQLIAADGATLLDAVGYDTGATDLVVKTSSFGTMQEGSATYWVGFGSAIARDANSTDTNDNRTDFKGEADPTPGTVNAFTPVTVTSITPDNGLATTTTAVSIIGTGFGDGLSVTFNGTKGTSCFEQTSTLITCKAPAGTVGQFDVVVANSAAFTTSPAVVTNGWTWTGVLNETDTGPEADYCVIQFPKTVSDTQGTSETFYGQIFEGGYTDSGGATNGIRAEFGYGATGVDPTTTDGFTYVAAPFNTNAGNNYEYQATVTSPAVTASTNFGYVYRFSFDNGLNYTYCDQDGAGSNTGLTFDPAQLGVWTVNP